MPGTTYLEKINGYEEKSPGLRAKKRFLLEGLQDSSNRKRLIAAINNVCKMSKYNTVHNGGRKKAIEHYYDV